MYKDLYTKSFLIVSIVHGPVDLCTEVPHQTVQCILCQKPDQKPGQKSAWRVVAGGEVIVNVDSP